LCNLEGPVSECLRDSQTFSPFFLGAPFGKALFIVFSSSKASRRSNSSSAGARACDRFRMSNSSFSSMACRNRVSAFQVRSLLRSVASFLPSADWPFPRFPPNTSPFPMLPFCGQQVNPEAYLKTPPVPIRLCRWLVFVVFQPPGLIAPKSLPFPVFFSKYLPFFFPHRMFLPPCPALKIP